MSSEIQNTDTVLQMVRAGVLFGHKKTKTHPRMKPYIGGRRNEIEILDPEITEKSLQAAAEFLRKTVQAGGLILCVGTRPAAKASLQSFAEILKAPYVTFRWVGGILTNFKVIHQRSVYYQELKERYEKGELSKYTKKEQLRFAKEVHKLSRIFDGLQLLTRLPDALFIIDIEEHATAVREARRMHIPVVALVDTNDNPQGIDYPIFANDHARASIEWVIEALKKRIEEV